MGCLAITHLFIRPVGCFTQTAFYIKDSNADITQEIFMDVIRVGMFGVINRSARDI
jgi:hypothetical protein